MRYAHNMSTNEALPIMDENFVTNTYVPLLLRSGRWRRSDHVVWVDANVPVDACTNVMYATELVDVRRIAPQSFA